MTIKTYIPDVIPFCRECCRPFCAHDGKLNETLGEAQQRLKDGGFTRWRMPDGSIVRAWDKIEEFDNANH